MFFENKITLIQPHYKVLEIGPGASPHPRSDVFLEKSFSSDNEYEAQFGHAEKLVTDKKVVFYDGGKFPFKDKEFDYVICSHVIEHVDDLPGFLAEVFRVSSKGYFEYPLIYYEYLYNFDVHLNFVKYNDGVLYYLKKNKTHLNEFAPVQRMLLETLRNGHDKIVSDQISLFMEGFEWESPFKIVETDNVTELTHKSFNVQKPPSLRSNNGADESLKQLIKKIIKKII